MTTSRLPDDPAVVLVQRFGRAAGVIASLYDHDFERAAQATDEEVYERLMTLATDIKEGRIDPERIPCYAHAELEKLVTQVRRRFA